MSAKIGANVKDYVVSLEPMALESVLKKHMNAIGGAKKVIFNYVKLSDITPSKLSDGNIDDSEVNNMQLTLNAPRNGSINILSWFNDMRVRFEQLKNKKRTNICSLSDVEYQNVKFEVEIGGASRTISMQDVGKLGPILILPMRLHWIKIIILLLLLLINRQILLSVISNNSGKITNKMKKQFFHLFILLSFLVTMICFIVILITLFSKVNWDDCAFSKDFMGNIGDFLSGTIGVFLSFISFLLMWKTFSTQYRQFERQNELQNQASFETTYFNLLLSLEQVRKDAVQILKEKKQVGTISEWYQLFIKTARMKKNELIIHPDDVLSQVEATQGVAAKCYEDFIAENGYIGFYFRFIYNTIKFSINYWNNYAISRKYTDLLCAKLSYEELALLFYNALSKYARDQNEGLHFKEILDEYQIFENLNHDYLIDRSHFRFYPQTDFKFLTRHERKQFLKAT